MYYACDYKQTFLNSNTCYRPDHKMYIILKYCTDVKKNNETKKYQYSYKETKYFML